MSLSSLSPRGCDEARHQHHRGSLLSAETVAAIDRGICHFLATHPASPALCVAQHVWGEVRDVGRELHVDSWVWIREQLERLASTGVLARQQRSGAALWSLADLSPLIA